MKINKRGQIRLSFGMIFSIILIVIFIAFAFFAIKKFIGIGNAAQIGQFKDNLQADIDQAWKANQVSKQEEYFLPSKIKWVCFVDYDENLGARPPGNSRYDELKQNWFGSENMFFYPIGSAESLESTQIKHIDMEKITRTSNPFCIENKDGKVQITLKKDYGNNFVRIE